MEYEFRQNGITQHVVKYGIDLRPPLSTAEHRGELQDYCNWLIEHFGETFEILLSAPNQLNIQKNFPLPGGRKVQFPTFMLSPRGPVVTFPHKLFIDGVQTFDIPNRDTIFREALSELKGRFLEQKVARVGVINELVFDTGELNSTALLNQALASEALRETVANLTIRMEMPTADKNVNLQLRPTHVTQTAAAQQAPAPNVPRFGLAVNLDINNRVFSKDLPSDDVDDILAFSSDYVANALIPLLNSI